MVCTVFLCFGEVRHIDFFFMDSVSGVAQTANAVGRQLLHVSKVLGVDQQLFHVLLVENESVKSSKNNEGCSGCTVVRIRNEDDHCWAQIRQIANDLNIFLNSTSSPSALCALCSSQMSSVFSLFLQLLPVFFPILQSISSCMILRPHDMTGLSAVNVLKCIHSMISYSDFFFIRDIMHGLNLVEIYRLQPSFVELCMLVASDLIGIAIFNKFSPCTVVGQFKLCDLRTSFWKHLFILKKSTSEESLNSDKKFSSATRSLATNVHFAHVAVSPVATFIRDCVRFGKLLNVSVSNADRPSFRSSTKFFLNDVSVIAPTQANVETVRKQLSHASPPLNWGAVQTADCIDLKSQRQCRLSIPADHDIDCILFFHSPFALQLLKSLSVTVTQLLCRGGNAYMER
jgi:hypothetical protein